MGSSLSLLHGSSTLSPMFVFQNPYLQPVHEPAPELALLIHRSSYFESFHTRSNSLIAAEAIDLRCLISIGERSETQNLSISDGSVDTKKSRRVAFFGVLPVEVCGLANISVVDIATGKQV